MNLSKIVNLLNRVLNSNGIKLKKQNEYMYWSPFVSHHKRKLQVNIVTGKWHCWVSNEGGHNLFQLFKKVGTQQKYFEELYNIVGEFSYKHRNYESDTDKKKIVKLPKEFLSLTYKHPSPIYKHAMSYLTKRGITYEDILKYNIGYCDQGLYTNRVIIPSYDLEGQLNFFVGRDIYSSKLKYRNTPTTKDIIGFELFINWDEPIILCEGVFDAMTFKRNAIPLFGKTVMSCLQKKIVKSKVKVIYLALDNDAISDAVKLSENFINNGIEVKMMEFEEKDPNETGFEKLLYLIDRTKQLGFSDLMKIKLNGTTKKHMEI
jgi:DNA primase